MDEIDTSVSYGVYRIVSPNGSCYIGMTAKSFDERWDGHRKSFRLGSMVCTGLRRAFEKYGPDRMVFEALEDLTGYGDDEVLYRERVWWLRHRAWGVNLYNGEPTGRGAVRHTEETRKRIGDSLRKELITLKCLECEESFSVQNTSRDQTFCSVECVRLNRKSKPKTGLTSRISREYLLELFSRGLTKPEIAKVLKCSVQSVCDLERFHGVYHPPIRKSLKKYNLKCLRCSKEFLSRNKTQKFCSKRCYWNKEEIS